jgi:hypothetical protein
MNARSVLVTVDGMIYMVYLLEHKLVVDQVLVLGVLEGSFL